MKRLSFARLFCALFLSLITMFAFGQDTAQHNPNYIEGGPLAGGWWIIIVVFGLLLPAFLIAQGASRAKEGTFTDAADGSSRTFDPTPQPWYKHNLSIAGITLFVAAVVTVILRLMFFK